MGSPVTLLGAHPAQRIARHTDVLRLLVRHARGDLLDQAGLEAELQDLDRTGSAGTDHDDDARQFASDLESMGPTFVKLGQVLSTRADLLPENYLLALRRLQDEVEPIPVSEVRAVIEDELGLEVKDLFADFDDEPMAAASLAQVHRATLANGTRVVVKVQRPGIADTVREDLRVLGDLARLVDSTTEVGRRFAFGEFLDSFRTSFVAELDFRTEADNLHAFGDLLTDYERINVPRPIDQLVTRRVLTMTCVDGIKVTELGPLTRQEIDGAGLADELTRAYIDQILVHGLVHADPHPGNVLLSDGEIVLLDLGMVTRLGHGSRRHLLDLMLAIAEQRADDAVDVLREAGTPLAGFDARSLESALAELLSRHAGAAMNRIDTGSVLLALSRACATAELRPPAELAMVGKAMLHLDEVTRRLDPDFVPNRTVEDHAGKLLRLHVEGDVTQLRAARATLDMGRFMENLPRRADRVLGDLADGKLRINVDAIDQDELLRGFEKIATRVTAGIVLAAMLIGASLAMRIESDVQLLGAPALATVFFVLSGIGGLVLVTHVFVIDRRDRMRRRRLTR